MDIDVLAIAAVAITVVLFVLLSYLGRKKHLRPSPVCISDRIDTDRFHRNSRKMCIRDRRAGVNMANIREIQSRINSVKDTMKITNAMYMISSSKMTQARKKLADTEPYFYGLQGRCV